MILCRATQFLGCTNCFFDKKNFNYFNFKCTPKLMPMCIQLMHCIPNCSQFTGCSVSVLENIIQTLRGDWIPLLHLISIGLPHPWYAWIIFLAGAQDPRKQLCVLVQRTAMLIRALTHTFKYVVLHWLAIILANCFTKAVASLPISPSVELTNGVKFLCWFKQALRYLFFFYRFLTTLLLLSPKYNLRWYVCIVI
jgi:hypothetical protein